jgi:putative flavoprotein involved in K+ transport
MNAIKEPERIQTLVIGAGQAGLSVGYHLALRRVPFLILDANERIGDSWRTRWDSLRLFTPARLDGIDGMPFPAPPNSFPTKDAMGDYLSAYAARFALPVRSGIAVDGLSRQGNRYLVSSGDLRFEAQHVIIAMATYQKRKVPVFAADLNPTIVQLHSSEYRNPGQLRKGDVLIVGAGNSGAEIAMELARSGHRVLMSGRGTGHLPFKIDGTVGRYLARFLLRFVFHRILTVNTSPGRKMRTKVLTQGGPLIRVKPSDLLAAGVERVGRTAGVTAGLPVLADNRVLDVENVIWCTGYDPGHSWIHLPVFDKDGEPRHERGVVRDEPGLYFVGWHFLYAASSTMIHGVGRDAAYLAEIIAARIAEQPDPAGHRRLAGFSTPASGVTRASVS